MVSDETIDIHVSPFSSGHSYWDRRYVVVHGHTDGETRRIAEYIYGYNADPPWLVFEQDEHRYALFATSYTAASVMDLETGETIASEPPATFGFCPVRFQEDSGDLRVYGCVWGGPYGWYTLDVSRIREGHIERVGDFESDEIEMGEDDEDDE